MSRIPLLAGVSCAALALTSAAHAQTPVRAATFLGSLGVNTHLSWWDTAWGVGNGQWAGAESKVLGELAFLGVKNVRDSTPSGSGQIAEMTDLAKAGYKFDLEQTITSGQINLAADVAAIASLQAAVPGSALSYEGANEYNTNSYTLNGQSSNGNLAWGAIDDQATRAALLANPATSGVTFIAATTAGVNSAPSIVGMADHSSWHVYGGIGEQLAKNLMGGIAAAQATLPGKPVEITETGISSVPMAGQSWGASGDEYTQGLIVTNAVLDTFKGGAVRTYLYSLMDNKVLAGDLESNFGLFHADGTAKAAATDLHNLTAILGDAAPSAASFALSAPGFALPTLPAGASSMLLQKASGAWDLVLWNSSATVWSGTAAVTPTPVAVTMPLAGTYASVKVYDPITGANPVQTLANASSVSLSLGKEPQVIEIAGLVPPVAPVPVAAVPGTGCGAATDTLRLTVAEDAYQGDAQFTVSVDGKQVGGTYSATASHAASKTSDLVLTGTWGSGPHTVAVAFLNDAYGGSATTDRNLYVTKAPTYDGVPSTGAAAAMLWQQTVTWTVGQ